jgi:hypothetical protein
MLIFPICVFELLSLGQARREYFPKYCSKGEYFPHYALIPAHKQEIGHSKINKAPFPEKTALWGF